jgi:hypothetical protein
MTSSIPTLVQPTLVQLCCKSLATHCGNKGEVIYSNDLIPLYIKRIIFNYSDWSLTETRYTYGTSYSFSPKPGIDAKISKIKIIIHNNPDAYPLEVYVYISKKPAIYFNIIEKALLLDNKKYIFDSGGNTPFPRNINGLCTIETVRKLRFGLVDDHEFERRYSIWPLKYQSSYTSSAELSQKINEALGILGQVDETVGEIPKFLVSLL